jgi:hypothetical protein
VLDLFADRILPFDTRAARRYADLAVRARAAGKGFPTPDGYIAAIAAAHGFAVASRDTSAFTAAGPDCDRSVDRRRLSGGILGRPGVSLPSEQTTPRDRLVTRPPA